MTANQRSGLRLVGIIGLVALAAIGCGGRTDDAPYRSEARRNEGADGPFKVESSFEAFVDDSRPTRLLAGGTTPTRTILVRTWFPVGEAVGRSPLVVFGHGFGDDAPTFAPLLTRWAAAGYVVAAPTYPATNVNAPGSPDLAGYDEQPGDVSFLLDELLQLDEEPANVLRGRIDHERIAVGGHSLGAVTTFGLAYNSCCRDERVDALVPLAGIAAPFPDGEYDYATEAPGLFIHGDADPDYPSGVEVYRDAPAPKFLLTLVGADHRPFDGTWDATMSDAVVAFLDHFLKGRTDGLTRLDASAITGLSTLEGNAETS